MSGLGDLETDVPGPGAAICGAPKLITRPRQWPFRCEYGTPSAMNRLLIAGILIISTAPLYAQRHQQNVARLKADARNVVGTIANDKAKTQAYCQVLDLARQLVRADQVKDTKKAKTLSENIDQLQKQLGPEFVALMNCLAHLDRRSPDGREVALIIESLNQWCLE